MFFQEAMNFKFWIQMAISSVSLKILAKKKQSNIVAMLEITSKIPGIYTLSNRRVPFSPPQNDETRLLRRFSWQ